MDVELAGPEHEEVLYYHNACMRICNIYATQVVNCVNVELTGPEHEECVCNVCFKNVVYVRCMRILT